MDVDEFLRCVKRGDIPPEPPFISRTWDYSSWMYRDECTDRGMWAIVDMKWTKQLADWIGDRTVLEIMAGCGWLAKALTLHGVEITATDNHTWADKHGDLVHPVIKAEACEAIRQYPADILICSWPPYKSDAIVRAMEVWGSDRPVVYIGEDCGGCNAPDDFFSGLRVIDDHPRINLARWRGINDDVQIGYWKGE